MNNKDPNNKENINDRRRSFLTTTRNIAIASLGGFVWSGYISEAKTVSLILRPPAALDEKEFLKTCIKCGMCVEVCPYNTLVLAKPGDNKPLGTPYFTPRNIPCYMCEDIPCVPVCPSGALDIKKVLHEDKLDINKSKMGLAIVDKKSCVAFWGIQCDACYRACPLLDKAIKLEYRKNERTGKHAYLEPVVDSEYCTGCGICERACITKKPAIFVLPLNIALGEVGSHYIKGWESKDENRLQKAKTENGVTEINKKSAIDSLNEGMLDE